MAPPTLLTGRVRADLVAVLRAGVTRREAAAHAGIAERSLKTWCARGRRDRDADVDSIHATLLTEIEQAEATARVEATLALRRAMLGGDYWAALQFLARRDPSHWSHRRPAGLAVALDEPVVDVESARELVAYLLAD